MNITSENTLARKVGEADFINSLKGPTVGNPVPINREEMKLVLRQIFEGE